MANSMRSTKLRCCVTGTMPVRKNAVWGISSHSRSLSKFKWWLRTLQLVGRGKRGTAVVHISGPLCVARPVDRWGCVDPRDRSFLQFLVLRCLCYLLHSRRENPLQSPGPLGLIAVAADRFSVSLNVGVCPRKLRCKRLLVLVCHQACEHGPG